MTVFKTRRAGSHLLVRVQTHERARAHTNAFTGQPDENARDRLMGPKRQEVYCQTPLVFSLSIYVIHACMSQSEKGGEQKEKEYKTKGV